MLFLITGLLQKKMSWYRVIYIKKIFPETAYDAHRALEDVQAMEKLFTSTPLVSMLSSLTVWKIPQLLQAWQDKINKNNRIQQIVIGSVGLVTLEK